MLLFLMLFLAIECFGLSNPLTQAVPLSTLNFTKSHVTLNIKFNQTSLNRIISHVFLLNDSSGKIDLAIQGFIAYGEERYFTPSTVLGHLEEIVGYASTPFDLVGSPNQGNLDNQMPVFSTVYPLDVKLKIVLDPVKFQLPQGTDLSVIISNDYTVIESTPAMKALVKQMIKKENSINV
jgi:hypothetical protein